MGSSSVGTRPSPEALNVSLSFQATKKPQHKNGAGDCNQEDQRRRQKARILVDPTASQISSLAPCSIGSLEVQHGPQDSLLPAATKMTRGQLAKGQLPSSLYLSPTPSSMTLP